MSDSTPTDHYEEVMACIEANLAELRTLMEAAFESSKKVFEPDKDGDVGCLAAAIIMARVEVDLGNALEDIKFAQRHLASDDHEKNHVVRNAQVILMAAFPGAEWLTGERFMYDPGDPSSL